MSPREQILLLGADHPDYGAIELRTQRAGASAGALTVGSDPLAISRLHKARSDIPNEDGLLLVDDGDLTLLAVADGHHGHEASHGLLRRLAELTSERLPGNPLALLGVVRDCADEESGDEYPAASSFLVAIWNRESRTGFGSSFGDSTLAVIRGAASGVDIGGTWDERAANFRNSEYVTPLVAHSLDPRRAVEFAFRAGAGDVVVAFTDGVDGCHYGFPKTSVQPAHLHGAWASARGDVATFARGAVELALAGVDGRPGGQDNIALIATSA